MLTDEELARERKYFDAMFSLFGSDGWKFFITEVQEQSKGLDDLSYIKTIEDLWYVKGQLETVRNLLNLEDSVRRAEEEFNANLPNSLTH